MMNLVETQAELRGCDLIEQISPLNVIDVNKVKSSSLSSSSLGIKIVAVDDLFADHVPDSYSFVASDVPATDSELPSIKTITTVPTENATAPRGFCPCCSRSDICIRKTLNYAGTFIFIFFKSHRSVSLHRPNLFYM
jgi:hypothetical protein